MVKGLVVSVVLATLLASTAYAVIREPPWGPELLALAAAPFPVIGLILGYAGTRIRARRFLKLFGLGVVLIYATALSFAAAMILFDGSGMIPPREIPVSILWLGTVGFVLYAAFTIPVLSVGVFAIERWTRPLP